MMFWWWSFVLQATLLLASSGSVCSLFTTTSSGNETDRLALLDFKNRINEDPLGTLSSWNNSLHYCDWNGVTCDGDRVIVLDLEDKKLQGTLSPHMGNLSFLRTIILTMNNFHGPIPQELGRLFSLQDLFLNNNTFSGEIPANLSHCFNLKQMNLIDNNLTGKVPGVLSSLSKLSYLGLGDNQLQGTIPPSIGNLSSSLTVLDLGPNNLEGSIPHELCHLKNLYYLGVGVNNLMGKVPDCVYNLSRVTEFGVAGNQLQGEIPSDIGVTLPNLQYIYLGRNQFTGSIPDSFSNASALKLIALDTNSFSGTVPKDLGKLQGLRFLYIHTNQLGSMNGDDLDFITSLTNCSTLELLEISTNSLKGSIPKSIANLSSQIRFISLRRNQIYGSIPVEIGNLVSLSEIRVGYNYLTGEIPRVIGMFFKMHRLYFRENQLSGRIPNSFSNLTQLEILDLSGNVLVGSLPTSLGDCQNLIHLDLSDNNLTGTIPKQIIGHASIKVLLNLSNNALSGSLPEEVGDLVDLQALDISRNKLSGYIPDTVGKCLTLEKLYMAGNSFTGKLPQSLSTLRGLQELDLSQNQLSGKIPGYFSNFTQLTYLNLSYNELEGPVANNGIFSNASAVSVVGNTKLCGGVVKLKLLPCHNKTSKKNGNSLILKVVVPVILICICLVLLLCLHTCNRRRDSEENPSSALLLTHINPRPQIISYAMLLKATNNFAPGNLIGVGSYGSVYKGVLDKDDTIIAVKVLNLQQQGASKSFWTECNALRNLRHRNLLKIITSCSTLDSQGNRFKALIFEFMPNGSLEEWLHPDRDQQLELRSLNFLERLTIAIDVASVLDYLHHHCQPTILHCDLKPSSILLNNDMTAHVADFGLAKIFSAPSISPQGQGSSVAIKGSIGYVAPVAPEYGMGVEVSMQGDVYSYGILLLELFTGKRPTHDMFRDGQNLHNFAKAALHEQVMDIMDPSMVLKGSSKVTDIVKQSDIRDPMIDSFVSVIKLGVACSAESPSDRMNVAEALTELYHIRDHHQGIRTPL